MRSPSQTCIKFRRTFYNQCNELEETEALGPQGGGQKLGGRKQFLTPFPKLDG